MSVTCQHNHLTRFESNVAQAYNAVYVDSRLSPEDDTDGTNKGMDGCMDSNACGDGNGNTDSDKVNYKSPLLRVA